MVTDKKRKICFISASWVREREILAALNKHVDLLFVCPYQQNNNYSIKDVSSFCEANNIKFIINDFTNCRASNPARIVKDFKLVSKIKKFNPEITYIEAFGSPYFAIYSRVFLGSKNTIIAIMDYKLHQRSMGQFKISEKYYRFIQLKFYKNFQFFSYSQEKLFLKEHPSKTSFVIRLFLVGTNLPKEEQNSQNRKPNLLFFGRIFFYKGVDVLIKAANLLAKKRRDFKIIIAGNCKNWNEEYQPLIENPDVFDLRIRYISAEELADLYNKSDYLITPYREVTQSGPLLRAYYYDLIPIASDEDGFTEYIDHGKNGFLFKNESVEDLAKVLEKVLNLTNFEKHSILNQIELFKTIEFDLDNVVKKYINMFDSIAKNN